MNYFNNNNKNNKMNLPFYDLCIFSSFIFHSFTKFIWWQSIHNDDEEKRLNFFFFEEFLRNNKKKNEMKLKMSRKKNLILEKLTSMIFMNFFSDINVCVLRCALVWKGKFKMKFNSWFVWNYPPCLSVFFFLWWVFLH